MQTDRPKIIRYVKIAAVYLLIWMLILAAFAAQYRWGIELSWPRSIVRVIVDWSPWIILAPFVWWLAIRFSIFEERGRIRKIFIHVLASLALVVVAESMIVYIIAPTVRPMVAQDVSRNNSERRGPGPGRPATRRGLFQDRQETGESPFQTYLLAHKAQFWFPLYWVIVFLTSSARHFREAQEREKKSLQLQRDLATAQLTAIQSKLEPHPLFSFLSSTILSRTGADIRLREAVRETPPPVSTC